VVAARALLAITGDAVPAARVVREVLAAHAGHIQEHVRINSKGGQDRISLVRDGSDIQLIPWDVAAEILSAAPPQPSDAELLLGVLHTYNEQQLLPLLARLGPAAAPAVPRLRRFLDTAGMTPSWDAPEDVSNSSLWPDELAARALGAIGAAARPALPDLHRWVALSGDVRGCGREAIRAIEAAPK
jgi:hypothetical protein